MPQFSRLSSKLFTILGAAQAVATPTFTITPSTNTVSEGSTVTFTVTLSGGAPDGTYYVRVNSLTGSVVPDDFSTALPPNLTLQVAVSGGSGSLALTIQSDGDTEASDSFNVSLISSWGNTTVLANSSTVTISDATPPNGWDLGNQYNGVMQSGENIFPDAGSNVWPVMQMRYFEGASSTYGLWLNHHATYQSTVPYTANAIQGNGNGGGVLLVVDNTNNRLQRFNIPYKDFRSWNRPEGWDFQNENYQRWNSTSYHANPLPVVSNPHNLWVKEGGRQYIITDRAPSPHNMRLWHGEFGLEGPGGVQDTYRINVGGGISFTDWASYFSFNGQMPTYGGIALSNNGTYMFLATSTDLVRFTLNPAGYTSNSSITWGADSYWPYRQMGMSSNPLAPSATLIRGMTWNQATVSGQAAGKRFFYTETSLNRLYCAQAETSWNLGRVTTTFFRGISSGVQFFSLGQGLNSIFVDSTAASLYGTTATLTTYTAPGTADAATRPSIERWTLPAGFEISSSHTLTTRYFLRNYWVHRAQTMTGFIMNDARTKMIVASDTSFDGFYSYTLSTPGDISTALWDGNNTFPRINVNTSYGGSYSVGTNMSVWFKDDGLRCYAVGRTQIIQFDLLNAWEIGSAEYTGRFTISTQDATMNDIYIRDTGTQFWLCGSTNDRVYQYSMSTAWNITTASYTGTSYLNSGQETNATGLFFKSDGTRMYLLGTINRTVRQYTLNTAWSVASVTYVAGSSTRSVAAQTTAPAGMFIRDNGLQMVIAAGTAVIYFYTLGTAWDFAGTFTYNGSVTVSLETAVRGLFFRPAGDRFWTFGANGGIIQHDISAWSTSGYSLRSRTKGNGYFDIVAEGYSPLGTSTQGGIYTDDGLNFLIGYNNDLAGFTCSAAWNLSTMSYYWNHARSTTFPTQHATGQFRDIRRPTGNSSVLFTMRTGVLEKWTTTALLPQPGIAGWLSQENITSGIRADHARLTNYNATELSGVSDLKLYDNDRKLFFLNRNNSAILWRFDLTAPSTLVGATVTNTGGTLSADNKGVNTSRGFAFSREGNVLYLGDVSTSTTRIYRHNLTTPWTLSSSTFPAGATGGGFGFSSKGYYQMGSSPVGTTSTRKIRVRPDGTSFYVCTSDTIFQFNMSTPYELSSATYFGSYTVTPQTNMNAGTLRDFWIDKDTGSTLVCLSSSRALIGGFTLGTAWNITTTSRPGTTNTFLMTATQTLASSTAFWWPQGARAGYTVVVYNNQHLKLYKYELTVPWDTTTASYAGDSAVNAGAGGSYSGASRTVPINGIVFQDYNDSFGPYIGIGFDLSAAIDSIVYAPFGTALSAIDTPTKITRVNWYNGMNGASAPWDQEQRYLLADKWLSRAYGTSDFGGIDVVQSGTRIYVMEGSDRRIYSYRTYNPGGAWNNVAP